MLELTKQMKDATEGCERSAKLRRRGSSMLIGWRQQNTSACFIENINKFRKIDAQNNFDFKLPADQKLH